MEVKKKSNMWKIIPKRKRGGMWGGERGRGRRNVKKWKELYPTLKETDTCCPRLEGRKERG